MGQSSAAARNGEARAARRTSGEGRRVALEGFRLRKRAFLSPGHTRLFDELQSGSRLNPPIENCRSDLVARFAVKFTFVHATFAVFFYGAVLIIPLINRAIRCFPTPT